MFVLLCSGTHVAYHGEGIETKDRAGTAARYCSRTDSAGRRDPTFQFRDVEGFTIKQRWTDHRQWSPRTCGAAAALLMVRLSQPFFPSRLNRFWIPLFHPWKAD